MQEMEEQCWTEVPKSGGEAYNYHYNGRRDNTVSSSFFFTDCDDKECEQLCLNTGHGKGVCACVEGYYLDTDGTSCIGKSTLLSHVR